MANQPWQDDGWTAAAAKSHCWQTVLKLRTFSPLYFPLQGPAACPHAVLSEARSYRGPSWQDLRGCWLKVSACSRLFAALDSLLPVIVYFWSEECKDLAILCMFKPLYLLHTSKYLGGENTQRCMRACTHTDFCRSAAFLISLKKIGIYCFDAKSRILIM